MSDDPPPPKDITDVLANGGQFDPHGRPMNGSSNGRSNVIDLAKRRGGSGLDWRGGRDVFVPLPSTSWVCQGLQLGPGRPAVLAGFGASAKTYSVQAAVLSVATGRPIWGRFDCARGIAKHIDYEQGFSATARRYQWLAKGMGIDPVETYDRLFVSCMPECRLNSANAADIYAKACEGASLVVIDSLRGALPGEDENDSGIRSYVDVLTTASEKTGVTFLIVHHAGKSREPQADARQMLRGSSALFDAAGSVFVVTNAAKKDEPRIVQQVKLPADAADSGVGQFGLTLESVADEDGGPGGLRVLAVSLESETPDSPKERYEREAQALIELVRANQGCSQAFLRERAGFRAARVNQVLDLLVEEGRLAVFLAGQNGRTKSYRTADERSP